MKYINYSDYYIKKEKNEIIIEINENKNYHQLLFHLFSYIYDYLQHLNSTRNKKISVYLKIECRNKYINTDYEDLNNILLFTLTKTSITINEEFDNLYNDFIKIKDIINSNSVKLTIKKIQNSIK